MKVLISIGAVAALALTSAPAAAQHHSSRHSEYNQSRDRHYNDNHRGHRAHKAKWNRGHRFSRNYRYTSYNALPRQYVRQYNLSPRYRYVYTDGYIYQVDPTTYAIRQILSAFVR